MIADTATIRNDSVLGRSAKTNGTRLLDGIDGRSKAARRFRDLVTAYCAELKTDMAGLTESQRSTVRQAAGVAVQCEAMQTAIVRGDAIDVEQLVRLNNLFARLMTSLGLGDAKPAPTNGPRVRDFLEDRAA